jgi:hypothetical protein
VHTTAVCASWEPAKSSAGTSRLRKCRLKALLQACLQTKSLEWPGWQVVPALSYPRRCRHSRPADSSIRGISSFPYLSLVGCWFMMCCTSGSCGVRPGRMPTGSLCRLQTAAALSKIKHQLTVRRHPLTHSAAWGRLSVKQRGVPPGRRHHRRCHSNLGTLQAAGVRVSQIM